MQTIFAKGAHYAIKELSQTGYDVVSLDWTMSAKDARWGKNYCKPIIMMLNPFSPRYPCTKFSRLVSIHRLKECWVNLKKDQRNSLVINFLILIHFSLDDMQTMLGENWCWSLVGPKGLKGLKCRSAGMYFDAELLCGGGHTIIYWLYACTR